MTKGRLQNPTAGWPAVSSGSGRFFIVLNNDNRPEPGWTTGQLRLSFEAAPNLY